MGEKYFDITFLFGKSDVLKRIDQLTMEVRPGYVCLVDGVSVSTAQQEQRMKTILNNASLVACDSGWIPVLIRCIYGHKKEQYASSDLFRDVLMMKKYKMMFLGTSAEILHPLRNELLKIDHRIREMQFVELPYCTADEFHCEELAQRINKENPDIIWISLGMPKQEIFMANLNPYLNKGVLIGVGSAFKYLSGLKKQKRAPKWMIYCKMEWVYRILNEPKKQLARCKLIICTYPKMFWRELKLKKEKPAK